MVAVCLFALSCKKTEEIGTPAEVTVNANSMGDFKGGTTINFFNVDLAASPIAQPVAGDSILFDYSNLSVGSDFGITYSPVDSNSVFKNAASFFIPVPDTFTAGSETVAATLENYYLINVNGWSVAGRTVPAVTLATATDTVRYPAQYTRYSERLYQVRFPVYYKDTFSTSNLEAVDSFRITVPSMGMIDSLGNRTTVYNTAQSVVARGKLKLKGFTEQMDVFVVKHIESARKSYTIGGERIDSLAINQILNDTAEKRAIFYEFYTVTKGYMGTIEMNETGTQVSKAYFRKNF